MLAIPKIIHTTNGAFTMLVIQNILSNNPLNVVDTPIFASPVLSHFSIFSLFLLDLRQSIQYPDVFSLLSLRPQQMQNLSILNPP
jgi:hypothetical protein